MKTGLVDFRMIKATVTMEMALTSYGVRLHRVDEHYLRGRCPLPTHVSKSSTQSLIVNTEKNAWVCHSASCSAARNGRSGGNVLDFVAWMENCSVRDAAVRLNDWFGACITPACQQPAPAGVDVPRKEVESNGRNPPLKFALT
jgi:hypothetical protein